MELRSSREGVSQISSRLPVFKNKRLILLSPILLLLLIILLIAIIAPFLEYLRLPISQSFYQALRPICHQWPTRCVWIFGSNTALCSRCLGFYFSLFLTGVFASVKRNSRLNWKLSLILFIPFVIDGYTQFMGWRTSNNNLRFITGFMAGVGIGLFIYPLYFKFLDKMAILLKRGNKSS
jgi:uncharacterized membrane protein